MKIMSMESSIEHKKLDNPGSIDKSKLDALVFDGFGKHLTTDYFQELDPEAVYIANKKNKKGGCDYLAAIVLLRTHCGAAYLDKFVVARDYQGRGIGKKLWHKMRENEEKIFWRAKSDNKINGFYREVCEGMQKAGGWNVYWFGLSPAELEKAIGYALDRKETLSDP